MFAPRKDVLVLTLLAAAAGQPPARAADVVLDGGRHRIAFRDTDGAIASVREGGSRESLFRSGEHGLWQLRFRDGSTLDAAAFRSDSPERRFEAVRDAAAPSVRLVYRGPEARVVITVTGHDGGFDFVGQVTPASKAVLDLVLPARLRFDPDTVRRVVSPVHPHRGVGLAFNGRFFKPQPPGKSPSGEFLKYESPYPPLFADFLHLDAAAGSASLYRVQPRSWKPWAGENDPAALFVPGRLALGGDAQGGWCERGFGTFVEAGTTWTAPAVRLALGGSAEDDLRAYCRANGITRRLGEKLPPELYDRLRKAVLVKLGGSARELTAALDRLPVPTLIHYADYLKGGFDKEYPDHLPPRPGFGTPEELRALHDRAHALGHLVMPYTNPTWWCDHPRGPTFEREGEAPLVRKLDGQLSHEKYGANDGWTVCPWHPAVRAANRRTLRQFTDDYPADILFQDQCGARTWTYDRNPASPTPYAYAEGLLSLVDEESALKPLSTEDGWDRMVNAEVQLCGFTFALGPGPKEPWAPELKSVYPPETWELYPFVQQVAHDKAALLHHDLGKFVTDRPALSWTLGLGFGMSYVVHAPALEDPGRREWLRWLDRVQKSVCARSVGEPVTAFAHRQGGAAPGDDGVIRAAYGPVKLVANLGPEPLRDGESELAGYGFRATAPGLVAANLRRLAGVDFGDEGVCFVTEGDARRADVWVRGRAGADVAAELPEGLSGKVTVALDGQPAQEATVAGHALSFRLPAAPPAASRTGREPSATVHFLWHATVAVQGP